MHKRSQCTNNLASCMVCILDPQGKWTCIYKSSSTVHSKHAIFTYSHTDAALQGDNSHNSAVHPRCPTIFQPFTHWLIKSGAIWDSVCFPRTLCEQPEPGQTTDLPISRRPTLPPEPQLPQISTNCQLSAYTVHSLYSRGRSQWSRRGL